MGGEKIPNVSCDHVVHGLFCSESSVLRAAKSYVPLIKNIYVCNYITSSVVLKKFIDKNVLNNMCMNTIIAYYACNLECIEHTKYVSIFTCTLCHEIYFVFRIMLTCIQARQGSLVDYRPSTN